MTLEDYIRAAVAAGELRGLTLFYTGNGRWQAARSRDGVGYLTKVDDDPVSALLAALGVYEITNDNHEQEDIFQ